MDKPKKQAWVFLGLMILRELASLFYCFAFNASSIIAFSSGLLGAGAAKDSTRAFAVDKHKSGHARYVIVYGETLGPAVDKDEVARESVLLNELFPAVALRPYAKANAHECEIGVRQFFFQLLEIGHHADAGCAPRSPDVYNNHLSAQIAQR